MTFQERYLVGCAALAVAALVTASPTRAQAPTQPTDAALNAEAAQNDWPTYHGTYKSYHYSGLDQINAGNVKKSRSRLDAFSGARHPRHSVNAAGR